MSAWGNILRIFILSMVPIIELRGAIPWGVALGMPWLETYIICVIGNMIPVPFIMLFFRYILSWMKGVKHLNKIALWIERKAGRGSEKIMKYASFGLMLFVAIPLPGTGAWTGAAAAALMNMRMRYAVPMIFLGVLIAGFIMTGVSYGFLGFLSFFA